MNQDSWAKKKITNTWKKHTLKIWSIVRMQLKLRLSTTMSVALIIADNPDFPPVRLDKGFKDGKKGA